MVLARRRPGRLHCGPLGKRIWCASRWREPWGIGSLAISWCSQSRERRRGCRCLRAGSRSGASGNSPPPRLSPPLSFSLYSDLRASAPSAPRRALSDSVLIRYCTAFRALAHAPLALTAFQRLRWSAVLCPALPPSPAGHPTSRPIRTARWAQHRSRMVPHTAVCTCLHASLLVATRGRERFGVAGGS